MSSTVLEVICAVLTLMGCLRGSGGRRCESGSVGRGGEGLEERGRLGAPGESRDGRGLVGELHGIRALTREAQQAGRLADRLPRKGGDRGDDLARASVEVGGRAHLGDKTPVERGRRVDGGAGQQEEGGPASADRAGQQGADAAVGRQPDAGVGRDECRVVGREHDVGGEDEADTGSCCGALDHRDDGDGQGAQGHERLVQHPRQLGDEGPALGCRGHGAHVAAGAEEPAVGPEDDDVHRARRRSRPAPTASRSAMAVGRSTALPASGRASRIVATPSDTDRSGTVVVTGSSCPAGAVLGRGGARNDRSRMPSGVVGGPVQ